MTKKRYIEIYNEAYRRMNLWLSNVSFDDMTIYGSKLRFEIALGLMGYPFELEKWMDKNDFKAFITLEEYESNEMDIIAQELFYIAMNCEIKNL